MPPNYIRSRSPIARRPSPAAPFQLLSQAGTLNIPPATGSTTNHATHITNHLALRLEQHRQAAKELQRSDKAILRSTTAPDDLVLLDAFLQERQRNYQEELRSAIERRRDTGVRRTIRTDDNGALQASAGLRQSLTADVRQRLPRLQICFTRCRLSMEGVRKCKLRRLRPGIFDWRPGRLQRAI